MPSPKEYITPALSSTVCILLQTLKERLQQIEEQLCQAVLNSLWQALTEKLNKFVYEEVSVYWNVKLLGGKNLHVSFAPDV